LIKSFKSKETARIFARLRSTRLPHDIQQISYRKLRMLNNAVTLADLRLPPANRLEKLSGDRSGQYSIRINDQWRINEIVLGKRRITADTALRLARYFGTSPQFWMGLQTDYDLDVAADTLGDRLDIEVRPMATSG
jgi:proteic killer suppression protein